MQPTSKISLKSSPFSPLTASPKFRPLPLASSRFYVPPINLLSKLLPQITFWNPRVVHVTPPLAPHCLGKLIRNTDSQGQTHHQKNGISGESWGPDICTYKWFISSTCLPRSISSRSSPGTLQSNHREHLSLNKNKLFSIWAYPFPSAWNILLLLGQAHRSARSSSNATSSGKTSSTPTSVASKHRLRFNFKK